MHACFASPSGLLRGGGCCLTSQIWLNTGREHQGSSLEHLPPTVSIDYDCF